jgi:hypothetical protein
MSQEQLILSHLKRKPLTPLEALFDYGCFRLAARVHDLRSKGYVIETREVVKDEKRYAQYWLESKS